MKLAAQWGEIEASLPDDWAEARLRLDLTDAARAARASALLGPAGAGRRGSELTLVASRTGGTSPFAVRRLLNRLDAEGIAGRLEVAATATSKAVEGPPRARTTFAVDWDAAVQSLPDDWSDLFVEAELDSSDLLPRAALLLAPVNPARYRDTRCLRFRVARTTGYGASAAMARRCLERLDDDGVRGTVRILRALSDTDHVGTQGPVWYVEGRAV